MVDIDLPLRYLTSVISTLTSNVPLHCLYFLRAAPLFVNENLDSRFLSVRTHFFLYPQPMEHISFPSSFIFLPSPRAVSDAGLSGFFEVCSFSLLTMFRTSDVGAVRLSSAGPLMVVAYRALQVPQFSVFDLWLSDVGWHMMLVMVVG
nr:hypothetical protein [Tanacetum cinerariifolium]